MNYEELKKGGFQFNGEQTTFYVSKAKAKSFKAPKGFESWDVEIYDPKEYFKKRIVDQMGVTPKKNKIKLFGGVNIADNEQVEQQIFSYNEYGDIEILLYTLHRKCITYSIRGEKVISNTDRTQYDIITRFAPWREQILGRKYHITGKTGTHPFFHPKLIEAFEKETEIKTLFITEGHFKAYTATENGIPCVGLSSITHYKDKKSKTLHPEIYELMMTCKVEKLVILWDGDCLDISTKAILEKEDLYKRPGGFFKAASQIQSLIKEYAGSQKTQVWFARIKSEDLNNTPKGVDDLIFEYNDDLMLIHNDIDKIGIMPSRFIHSINITTTLKKLYKYFNLHEVAAFYNFHQDKIGLKPFIFSGTQYQWDDEKSELKMQIPAAAKNYARIGVDYYKMQQKPDKHGNKVQVLARWRQGTIVQDHGKEFVNHIDKYEGFINRPEHVEYTRAVDGFYNLYYPIDFDIREGSCEKTLGFIRHIFQEHYELGLDYIQLLYQRPKQTLPILCLVSQENITGKTTFAAFLKKIFQNNMAIVGNADLANDFNSFWASKLVVCCDEAFIEKKTVVEKIKSLATADKITVNAKGKDQEEIDFYAKFLLLTNNEENFIYASDEDTRYWVRKIPKIKKEDMNPDLVEELVEEIPAFLYYLSNRQMHVQKKESRMWFSPKSIKTDALRKVIANSASTVEKEIKSKLKDMFLDFACDQIMMTTRDVKKHLLNNKYEENYLNKVLTEKLQVERYKVNGKTKTTRYTFDIWNDRDGDPILQIAGNGRPYVFEKSKFLTQDEIDNHENTLIRQTAAGAKVAANEDEQPF